MTMNSSRMTEQQLLVAAMLIYIALYCTVLLAKAPIAKVNRRKQLENIFSCVVTERYRHLFLAIRFH